MRFSSDVLIIGAGAAGLRAALEAKRCDVKVMLLCKGLIGKSGNTPLSGTAMSAVFLEEDNIEEHMRDTLQSGTYINDKKLVKILVNKGQEVIKQLTDYGVNLINPKKRITHRPGHTYPRSLICDFSSFHPRLRGLALAKPLTEQCKRLGVQFRENITITKLCKRGNKIYGAKGITNNGSQILIDAKAIVLATGGGGQIYLRNDNSSHATGDGYTLALKAGARLVDMEFVQFHPTYCHEPAKILVSSSLFGEGATLINSRGEQFMERYHEKGNMAPRDVKTRAIYDEIAKGRGINNGVYMDLSPVQNSLLETEYSYLLEVFEKHGIDILKEPIVVAPTCHFFMGGIKIDSSCYTGIPGLFAAGETTGGTHGANRLAGNSLTETQVFGKIAGINAAKYVRKLAQFPGQKETHREKNSTKQETQSDSIKIKELKLRLKRIMWKNASISRSERGLNKVNSTLNNLISKLDNSLVGEVNSRDLFELKSMLTTSNAVVLSALKRTETRGAHMRVDYPELCPEWKVQLAISSGFSIEKSKSKF